MERDRQRRAGLAAKPDITALRPGLLITETGKCVDALPARDHRQLGFAGHRLRPERFSAAVVAAHRDGNELPVPRLRGALRFGTVLEAEGDRLAYVLQSIGLRLSLTETAW